MLGFLLFVDPKLSGILERFLEVVTKLFSDYHFVIALSHDFLLACGVVCKFYCFLRIFVECWKDLISAILKWYFLNAPPINQPPFWSQVFNNSKEPEKYTNLKHVLQPIHGNFPSCVQTIIYFYVYDTLNIELEIHNSYFQQFLDNFDMESA